MLMGKSNVGNSRTQHGQIVFESFACAACDATMTSSSVTSGTEKKDFTCHWVSWSLTTGQSDKTGSQET